MSNGNGNGIEVRTPWLSLQGPGMFIVVLMLIGALVYSLNAQQDNYRLMQLEHKAMVQGLNDVFIAVMTPPEVKDNLPPVLKNKLQQKTIEKAKEKVE